MRAKMILEISSVLEIKLSFCKSFMYWILQAKYDMDFTSLQEVRAMFRKRIKSGLLLLSKPSEILLEMEIEARQI